MWVGLCVDVSVCVSTQVGSAVVVIDRRCDVPGTLRVGWDDRYHRWHGWHLAFRVIARPGVMPEPVYERYPMRWLHRSGFLSRRWVWKDILDGNNPAVRAQDHPGIGTSTHVLRDGWVVGIYEAGMLRGKRWLLMEHGVLFGRQLLHVSPGGWRDRS